MKKGIRGHSSRFEKKCARIKTLALFHRYGWPFLILILLAACSKGNPTSGVLAVSVFSSLFMRRLRILDIDCTGRIYSALFSLLCIGR